jgi:hypothetical protein
MIKQMISILKILMVNNIKSIYNKIQSSSETIREDSKNIKY